MQSTYLNYALRQLEAIVNIPSPSGFYRRGRSVLFERIRQYGLYAEITLGRPACLPGAARAKGFWAGGATSTLGAMVREGKANGAARVAPVEGLHGQTTRKRRPCVYIRARGGAGGNTSA